MGVLYKLTFSSGKAYIGITRRRLSARMQDHRKRAGRSRDDEKFAIYEAWRKYGEPTVEVLAVIENEYLAAAEIRAIELFCTLSPHGYNLTLGGDGVRTGREVSPITREKLRRANLGKKQSPETKKKRSEALKGKICSEETRRKIGEKNRINSRGKTLSEATRALIGKLSRGRTHVVSDEAKARMRLAKLGKKQSPEAIEKRRRALLGKKRSPEVIEKFKKSAKGRAVTCSNGITFTKIAYAETWLRENGHPSAGRGGVHAAASKGRMAYGFYWAFATGPGTL